MDLKITIIQANLQWENIDENLNLFAQKIKSINESTDIIVLPEMFNTGFSMNSAELAETMDGKTVGWMKEIAKRSNAVVVGSLIIKTCSLSGAEEKTNFHNRLIWAQPDGICFTYDKRHLFRMAGEHEYFSAGKKRLIIEYKGWKICPLICYDLRFPVWSRNKQLSVDSCQLSGNKQQTTNNKQQNSNVFDILIYIANWPEKRKSHWTKLLAARAIENQCYVVAVNRVGEDGNGFSYTGNSVVINFMGKKNIEAEEKVETIETVSLSLLELNTWREKFPVGMDGDEFEITP